MSDAPQFLQALPAETDATDGDIVTFQVKVANPVQDNTKPVVTWWRCGEMLEPMSGRREIIHHEDGWHELIISNVSEEDDGEYECRIENDQGFTSCFGSLYYYQRGATGTCTDVTLEGSFQEEGDGRQSALLIVIDDGSHTEEAYSVGTNRKSLTVSEQMQGIIEDLTQSSTQGDHTGSITMEKEDEGQFDSDIEIDDLLDEALRKTRESQETLVPEIPSPDSAEKAVSEGSRDPFALRQEESDPTRCRSNPTNVSITAVTDNTLRNYPWPPESVVTFDIPRDVSSTSVDLPAFETEEGTNRISVRTLGGDTPFGVADITEESVDHVPYTQGVGYQNGSTTITPTCPEADDLLVSEEFVASVSDQQVPPTLRIGIREAPTLTSLTESQYSQEVGILEAGYNEGDMFSSSRSAFRSTSLRYTSDGVENVTQAASSTLVSSAGYSRTQVEGTTVAVGSTFKSSRTSRQLSQEDESVSYSAKRSKISAYEADESSISSSSVKSSTNILAAEMEGTISEGGKCLDVYIAIMDFQPMESDEEAVPMKEGQEVDVIDASKPRRWLIRTRPMNNEETPREGWVPACYLEKSTAKQTLSSYAIPETSVDPKKKEAIENREAVVRELVETEEDFSKDMQFVVENYLQQMDDPEVPKALRDRKSSIFGNFKDICDFHNNVLMKGVHYHAKEPTKLGKTFLRLERDFDMHSVYCWNEARAQKLFKSDASVKEYFDNFSQSIGDDKTLVDHLKLPIQRLNDYQLLLKEIIKYSSRLNEDTNDLQKALDFIHSINKRTKDLQCIQAMQGCTGDMLKLGRIIRHDSFDVFEDNSEVASERYVFLFKGRIVIAEKQVSSSGAEAFQVTNIFKIPEVEFVESLPDDDLKILVKHSKKGKVGFPLLMRSKSQEQKTSWLKDVSSNSQVPEDLGEDEPVLEVTSELTETKDDVKDHKTQVSKPELKHRVSQEEKEEHLTEPKLKKTKPGSEDIQISENKAQDIAKVSEKQSSKEITGTKSTTAEKGKADTTDNQKDKKESQRPTTKRQTSHEEGPQKRKTSADKTASGAAEGPKKQGEEVEDFEGTQQFTVPPIHVMSDLLSESDARLDDSMDTCDDNATLASGSLRSPTGSMSPPPADGLYGHSYPYLYHFLILVPILCACYYLSNFF